MHDPGSCTGRRRARTGISLLAYGSGRFASQNQNNPPTSALDEFLRSIPRSRSFPASQASSELMASTSSSIPSCARYISGHAPSEFYFRSLAQTVDGVDELANLLVQVRGHLEVVAVGGGLRGWDSSFFLGGAQLGWARLASLRSWRYHNKNTTT